MDTRQIIQKSLDYIEDNLQADITAEELAEFGTTPTSQRRREKRFLM